MDRLLDALVSYISNEFISTMADQLPQLTSSAVKVKVGLSIYARYMNVRVVLRL